MTNHHRPSFSLSLPSISFPSPHLRPRSQSETTRVADVPRTNTVAVTSLPRSFFHPVILEVLRCHFATYGDIHQWVPLQGFSRIMVVYEHEEAAEMAKLRSDPIVLRGLDKHDRSEITLRVYRADPNPIYSAHSPMPPSCNYLRPPEPLRNFLVSPPGSPPEGWEQVREDPPNSTPLADDLVQALQLLQLRDLERNGGGPEVLVDPDDGCGVGVYLETCVESSDWDGAGDSETRKEEDWVYGQTALARERWRPLPTSLPPMLAA